MRRRWTNILIIALALFVFACALFVIIAVFAPGVGAQEQAPPFRAIWQRPRVARLSWTQPAGVAHTCLFRGVVATQSILIGCWADLPPGATGLSLGDRGPMDGAYFPQPHDIFILDQDGVVSRAPLQGVVLLPVMRR